MSQKKKKEKKESEEKIVLLDNVYQVPNWKGVIQVYAIPTFLPKKEKEGEVKYPLRFRIRWKEEKDSGGAMTLFTHYYQSPKTNRQVWTAKKSIVFYPNWTNSHVGEIEFDPWLLVVHSELFHESAKTINSWCVRTSPYVQSACTLSQKDQNKAMLSYFQVRTSQKEKTKKKLPETLSIHCTR